MNGYLLGVIGTVLLSAILTAILPEGKTNGVIKAIARMACILSIISPILSFLKSGDVSDIATEKTSIFFSQSSIESGDAVIQYYSEMRIFETERAIEKALKETYEVTAEVTLKWCMEKATEKYLAERIKVERITVRLSESVEEEVLEQVWNDLSKNYCSEVLIE